MWWEFRFDNIRHICHYLFMIRTQVYLPEETHKELHRLAEQSSDSFSELVRQGVSEVLRKKKRERNRKIPPLELPTFESGVKLKRLTREEIYENY